MKVNSVPALLALSAVVAASPTKRTVDTVYPYTGPDVPVGDWVNPTVNGNRKGFPRLMEPPAVQPASANPTNNINVISLAYLPTGINIHFQTPFGLGVAPSVAWGTSPSSLDKTATGISRTYDRTPPCSLVSAITQCSQFFHEVQIMGLDPDTTYYYKIAAANGTTASDIESFSTAREAGDSKPFSIAVLNDMGYTNAGGTMRELKKAVSDGIAFVWHGGDISYADDWYSGILPCESDWPVCYNGTSSELPGGVVDNEDYLEPLPAGEVPNQGGPHGGDMSVLYESNWDLWQQWTNPVTTKIPYMVMPGNHEASCAEFDGAKAELAAYLNQDQPNSTANSTDYLTYYSCPPSQRNFTAYINRFKMPGDETGGVGNFWYSFDYGLAHFVSIDGETDFPYSPEYPFFRDLSGDETHPTEIETYPTDSGPFGAVDIDNWKSPTAYQQYQWLAADLAAVDRTKTPWIIAMSHRPMYSSETASYESDVRAAFQGLMLEHGVDAYLSGHIHWYERMWPLTSSGAVDKASIINNNTYYTNAGVSMAHLINGMAGNIESHSELGSAKVAAKTAYLDTTHYGFNKLTFFNSTVLKFEFVLGANGTVADELTLIKPASSSSSSSSTSTSHSSTSTSTSATSTTTSSVTTTTTTSVIAPTCNHNNCLRAAIRGSASFTSFCATYTSMGAAPSPTIPSYLDNCDGSASKISSACSCLVTAA
ncbi:hypothetical protein B7463_g11347, partial [Scytalidium lignicola]